MIDLWTSRRDKFIECKYYSQDENDYVGDNEIAHYDTPTGTFFASEMGAKTSSSQIVADLFQAEEVSVVLKTEDDIDDLKRNDIVVYEDIFYRVVDIQKTIKKNQRQFLRSKLSAVYYISLRG